MAKRSSKSKKVAKSRQKTMKKEKKIKKSMVRLNPRKSVKKSKRSSHTPKRRRFYNVTEDAKIARALINSKGKTKSELSALLAKKLGRSVESVRDRIKRFIGRMNL